jgi:RNA polymerase sigma-70 factor (ECF subfamily)
MRRVEHDEVSSVAEEGAFARAFERHRRELRAHCYRMLGSLHEAEDLVQETLLRAWRRRDTFDGRATLRAWLYRIATNVCLDHLERHRREVVPYDAANGFGAVGEGEPPPFLPWIEPCPDRLLEQPTSVTGAPEEALLARESVSLAYLVAVQHLPPRQRAALLLSEVLDWSAAEVAELLDASVPSVKSALQRARAQLSRLLPRREERTPLRAPSPEEQALLARYVEAHERADLTLMAELLAADVRLTMPPYPVYFLGREALLDLSRRVFDPRSADFHGQWRSRPARANGQLAVAHYCERPSAELTRPLDGAFRAQVLDVLRIEGGVVVEITAFEPRLFGAFELPLVDSAGPRRDEAR